MWPELLLLAFSCPIPASLPASLAGLQVGETVQVEVLRHGTGSRQTVAVTLAERAPEATE